MATERVIALKNSDGAYDSGDWFSFTTDKNTRSGTADENIGNLYARLKKNDFKIVSSSPKVFSAIHPQDFTENFYISKEELKSYVKGFLESINSMGTSVIEDLQTSEDISSDLLTDSALDDLDIKLSLYRSFKSIYDKWIARSKTGNLKYFYNVNSKSELLFDYFRFIDRANNDIGGKAVIDISMLSNLANTKGGGGVTKTLYQTITDILSKNNFDFYPLPGKVDFSTQSMSDEELEELFKASDNLSEVPTAPSFVGMFVGGTSRFVDITRKNNSCNLVDNIDYTDDSFNISDITDIPSEFTGSKDNGIAVLEVKYGEQNQNHFFNIQLDQAEFKETQESLKIIEVLTNPKDGSSPGKAGKGNNLYDVYLTRSYKCTVESLGNMSIQPLMYFRLKNTPMFHGSYLITDVKHEIKPHYAKTTFTGLRQPKVTVPIVVDALSLLDLSLIGKVGDEIGQPLSELGNNGFTEGSISVGDGGSTIIPSDATILPPEIIDGITVSKVQKFWNSNVSKLKEDKVTGICLHWTAGYSYNVAASVLQKKGLGYHYIIHENGTVVQYSDVNKKAWHGGCASQPGYNSSTGNAIGCHSLNSTAIGISYIGGVKYHSTVLDDDIHNFKGNKQDNKNHVYIRTKAEWGMESLSIPNGKTTVQVYNAKKQFEGIINAILLAKQKYPKISYITSHHWAKVSKSDVGDDFPWTKLQKKIEELSGWKPFIISDLKDSNNKIIKESELPESVFTPEDVEMDETDKGT